MVIPEFRDSPLSASKFGIICKRPHALKESNMKTLICSIALVAGIYTTTARADTWTWTLVSNGSTLDAHLARCNFARPNPMEIFSMIDELQEKMFAPEEAPSAPRS